MTKITGTKTPAEQAKALKNAKGPKAGSARANQSVKLSDEDQKQIKDEGLARMSAKASKLNAKPDTIKEVKSVVGGGHTAVSTGKETLTYPDSIHSKELAKLAVVGASFKAVQEWLKNHKPEARLARGLDSRNAPQSAMSAAQSRAKGATPTPAPASTPAKGAKAPASAKAALSKGDFAYAVGKANDTREGTWTRYMVDVIQSATDTASAKAKHAKSGQFSGKKLDFTWAKAKGYIK